MFRTVTPKGRRMRSIITKPLANITKDQLSKQTTRIRHYMAIAPTCSSRTPTPFSSSFSIVNTTVCRPFTSPTVTHQQQQVSPHQHLTPRPPQYISTLNQQQSTLPATPIQHESGISDRELSQISRMLSQVKELPQTTTATGITQKSSIEQVAAAIETRQPPKSSLSMVFTPKDQSKDHSQLGALHKITNKTGSSQEGVGLDATTTQPKLPLWKRTLKIGAAGFVLFNIVNFGLHFYSDHRIAKYRDLAQSPEKLWESIENNEQLKQIYSQIKDIGRPLLFPMFQDQIGNASVIRAMIIAREEDAVGDGDSVKMNDDELEAEVRRIIREHARPVFPPKNTNTNTSPGNELHNPDAEPPVLNPKGLLPSLSFLEQLNHEQLQENEMQSCQQVALKHLLIIQELIKLTKLVSNRYHQFLLEHAPTELSLDQRRDHAIQQRLEQTETGIMPDGIDVANFSVSQWHEHWTSKSAPYRTRVFPYASILPETVDQLDDLHVALMKTAIQLIFFYHNTDILDPNSTQARSLRDDKTPDLNMYTHFLNSYEQIGQAKLTLRHSTNYLIYLQSICNDLWWASAPDYFKHNFQGLFAMYDDIAFKNYKLYQKDQVDRFIEQQQQQQQQQQSKSLSTNPTNSQNHSFKRSPVTEATFSTDTTRISPDGFNYIEPIFNETNTIVDQLARYQQFAISNQHPVLFTSQTLTPEEIKSLTPTESTNDVIDCLQFPRALPQSLASLEGRPPPTIKFDSTKGQTIQSSIPQFPTQPLALTPETVVSYDPNDYQSTTFDDDETQVPRTRWYYVPTPKFPTFTLNPPRQSRPLPLPTPTPPQHTKSAQLDDNERYTKALAQSAPQYHQESERI